MTWVYSDDSNSDANLTFDAVQNTLNELTTEQCRSAKVATSDEHDGDAQSVVFYDQSAPSMPPSYPAGPDWSYQTFSSSQSAVDFLNDELDTSQAYFAEVSMNDHKSGSRVIIIWYRADKQ